MSLPAAYVGLFESLAKVARENGYSLALHGSFNRDFDMVAIPWTHEAINAHDLIQKLHDDVAYLKIDIAMDDHSEDVTFYRGRIDGPQKKPHGRLAWNIHLGFGKKLDISVMPRIATEDQRRLKRETLDARNLAIYRMYMYTAGNPSFREIAAQYNLGEETVKSIIQKQTYLRRQRDGKKGLCYVERDTRNRRVLGDNGGQELGYTLVMSQAALVRLPKNATTLNGKLLSHRKAQIEADRLNQYRPAED
jgi:hypothetical protein